MPSITDYMQDSKTLIGQLQSKLSDLDEGLDLNRADIAQHSKDIRDQSSDLKELQKKMQQKVECDVFDKEINYLKSLLTHLRK